jgi:hypothetical protein
VLLAPQSAESRPSTNAHQLPVIPSLLKSIATPTAAGRCSRCHASAFAIGVSAW